MSLCRRCNNLDVWTLAVGGDRNLGWDVFSSCFSWFQDREFAIIEQSVGDLDFETGPPAIEIMANLVHLHCLGSEDFALGVLDQGAETGMPGRTPVALPMAGEKSYRPEFRRIARVARFRARQCDPSGLGCSSDRGLFAQSRQIIRIRHRSKRNRPSNAAPFGDGRRTLAAPQKATDSRTTRATSARARSGSPPTFANAQTASLEPTFLCWLPDPPPVDVPRCHHVQPRDASITPPLVGFFYFGAND